MTTYRVYLPPEGLAENRQEAFRLVPDAKAPLALIFPPFWLAWHRLWLPLMVYVAIMLGLFLFTISFPSIAVSYLSLLPGLYLLLEGYELVSNHLNNQGWQYAGIVEADDKEEAEIRFIVSSPHLFSEVNYAGTEKPSLMQGQPQKPLSLFPE